ncbi:MAG: hypothetical protein ACQESE_02830 [Nanobdellota archaeon]
MFIEYATVPETYKSAVAYLKSAADQLIPVQRLSLGTAVYTDNTLVVAKTETKYVSSLFQNGVIIPRAVSSYSYDFLSGEDMLILDKGGLRISSSKNVSDQEIVDSILRSVKQEVRQLKLEKIM